MSRLLRWGRWRMLKTLFFDATDRIRELLLRERCQTLPLTNIIKPELGLYIFKEGIPMLKKICFLLLAMVMVIGLMSVTAYAAGTPSDAASLQEALESGGVVTLAADIEITERTMFVVPEGTILNLNDHTVTAVDNGLQFAGEHITIRNGTIKCSSGNYPLVIGSSYTKDGSRAKNVIPTTATLNDVTMIDGGVRVTADATLDLYNCDIRTRNVSGRVFAVYSCGSKAQANIYSGIYLGGKYGYDVFAETNGKLVLYGGTYKVTNNKTFLAKDQNLVYAKDAVSKAKGISTTFSVVDAVAQIGSKGYATLLDAANSAKVNQTITLLKGVTEAGTFALPEGATLDLDGNTLTTEGATFTGTNITIQNGTINLPTGNSNYYLLYIGSQSAATSATLKQVSTGAGIQAINADVTLEDVTAKGGNKKSRFAVAAFLDSNVTIKSGSFTSHADAKRDLSVDDTSAFSVSGGLFSKNVPDSYLADGYISAKDGNKYIVREGKWVAEVNGQRYETLKGAADNAPAYYTIKLLCSYTTEDAESYALPEGATLNLDGNTLTTDGATFTGEGIKIENGTIEGSGHYVLYIGSQSVATSATLTDVETTAGIQAINAKVTLNNVTAKGGNNKSRFAVAAFLDSSVTIKSGSFTSHANAKRDLSMDATSAFSVSGGTFSKDVPDEYLADGYISVKNGSKYIVRQGKWVAKVNKQRYESLQAAIDAAPDYYDVFLLDNITVDEMITIDTSINLILGEYTITSNASVGVYSTAKKLVIEGTTGGIMVPNGTVAVGQDNGVCTINGGRFLATGATSDVANGKPVYNRYVLDNSDSKENGVTGSFVINGGSFYGFNPACMSINYHDMHDHDSIKAGYVAVLEDGWFTVVEGKLTHKVVCDCAAPAYAHEHCFASYEDAEEFIAMNGNCPYDKIETINKEIEGSAEVDGLGDGEIIWFEIDDEVWFG